MTRPRERRPGPDPVSPDEAAEIEAKYRLLDRKLKRYAQRLDARWAKPEGDESPREEGETSRPPPTDRP